MGPRIDFSWFEFVNWSPLEIYVALVTSIRNCIFKFLYFHGRTNNCFLTLMILGSFGMGFTCPNRFSKRNQIALFVVVILVLAFYLIVLWIISGALSNISSGTTI